MLTCRTAVPTTPSLTKKSIANLPPLCQRNKLKKHPLKRSVFRGEEQRKQKTPLNGVVLFVLAFPAGVEPTAFRLGGGRSILLSYGNLNAFFAFA